MGNDVSTGGTASLKATKRSGPLLVASWQKRKLPTQLFGVVRHAERADGVFAFWEGGRWSSSEDGRRFPLDPPLSDAGLDQADGLGSRIEEFALRKESSFHVVVCSPYSRCVQTAVKICKALGPETKMLIDLSLGEVFGPSVMGSAQPRSHLRSFSVAVEYCLANGVNVVRRVVGKAPVWPESLQDARRRFALRFLQYLHRGVVAKRNFLIVTHGDCIGSVMGIMPELQEKMVEKVDYGALLLGARAVQAARSPKAKAMASVLPLSPQEEELIGQEAYSPFQERLERVEEALEDLDQWATPVEKKELKLSQQAMSGWQCETLNVVTRSKATPRSSKLAKRLAALVESGPFSMQKVEKLLGAIAPKPLGDQSVTPSPAFNNSHTLSIQSGLSASTYLFGQSEVDSEDYGLNLSPSADGERRVLSSNLDLKRQRVEQNIRSISAAEKLSMKHYACPLEGVQELEEREASLKNQAAPVDSPSKIRRGDSALSGNSLAGLVNEEASEDVNQDQPMAVCGIPGVPLMPEGGARAGGKVCTETWTTVPEPVRAPVGAGSALAKRRASLNLKPLQ